MNNAKYFQFRAVNALIMELQKLNDFSLKWKSSKNLQNEINKKELICWIDLIIGNIESIINDYKPTIFKKENYELYETFVEQKDMALAFITNIKSNK